MEMCEALYYSYSYFIHCFFCTYLSVHFYIFNCLSFKLSLYYMNIF